MRNVALLTTTLLLLALSAPVDLPAQSTGDPEKSVSLPTTQSSNAEGTRFVVGFMKNEENTSICSLLGDRSPSNQKIVITSRYETSVTVSLPTGGTITRDLQPLGVETIFLNGDQYECLYEVCDFTVEITAEKPINVYGFSAKTHTSDGYLALPVSSWGTEYVTANYWLDYYQPRGATMWDSCALEPRGGEFAIIAGEDSTLVTVTPKTATRQGYPAGVPVRRLLRKGEMWQLEDGGLLRNASDITGSHVSADKPIGVLSGHVRAGIPTVYGTKDHLIEMLTPIEDLGSRHIIVPFGGRQGGDLARVIAAHPGQTTLTVSNPSGRLTYFLNGVGSYQELDIDQVTVVESSQNVLLAHYSQSNGVDQTSDFDPYMIVVTPESQFSKSAVFQTMSDELRIDPVRRDTSRKFNSHFVTIVAEKENFETLTLNGRQIAFLPYVGRGAVPTLEEDYLWVTLRINQNAAYVIEGMAEFGGYVYGIGQWDSYGWPVGTGDTPVLIDTIPPKLYAEPECGTLFWTITATDSVSATDSTVEDKGVLFLELDLNTAENVRVLSRTPDLPNAGPVPVAAMRLTLIDRTKPGRASVIVIDAGGAIPAERNRDTIEVELKVNPPLFSRDSLLISGARMNTTYDGSVEIRSENGESIRIDSLRLRRGQEFRLTSPQNGGRVDTTVAGEEVYTVDLSFLTDRTSLYTDTLVVWIDCIPYAIPLTAVMKVPAIDVDDLDFGTLRIGVDSCLQVMVTNSGEETLVITNYRVSTANGEGYFSFGSGNDPLPLRLEPGESTWVRICFDAILAGRHTGSITFTSNAAAGDSVGSLVGRVILPSLDIEGHDFGEVQVGETKCDSVPVTNPGSIPIVLTGVTIVEDVFVEDPSIFPYVLGPGDTLWVSLCFTPKREGTVDSPIGAENEEGLEAVAVLRGSGYVLRAEIDGYDWGRRWVGTTHDTIVHVRNLTDRTIEIDSIWLAGGDDGDFTLLTQVPPAVTLGPNEEYPLDVRFSPLAVGARSIGIYARTNSNLTPIVENMLQGFGVQPMPADELVHDSATIYSCAEKVSQVLLYNRGNVPLTLEQVRIDGPGGTLDPRIEVNAPPVGAQIPVGDAPLEIEIPYRPDGLPGTTWVTVRWSFEELPGEEFERTLRFSSTPQVFEVTAAAPPQIDNAQQFDLFLSLGDGAWPGEHHQEVILEIGYNPKVSWFDRERFEQSRLIAPTTDWVVVGTPEFFDSTTVRLRLRPYAGNALPLDGVTFPAIPFRGFFGDVDLDTFAVAMAVDNEICVLPATTRLPYSITNICGLSARLFDVFGDPPFLSQGKPNPARHQTTIDFTLPFEGEVSLELYSPDGALVTRLIDEVRRAGDYSVTIDLETLPSGVYYYRMEHGSYVATRALVVEK